VLLIVAIIVKIKMPGGFVLFVQKRVGKGGKLFNCLCTVLVKQMKYNNEII